MRIKYNRVCSYCGKRKTRLYETNDRDSFGFFCDECLELLQTTEDKTITKKAK